MIKSMLAAAAAGYLGWRAGRSGAVEPGMVLVEAGDLDLLLAHFYDEVTGTPDRSHWTFPLLREAAGRLAEAVLPRGVAAYVHPPRPAGDQRDEPPAAGYSGAI